MKPWVQILSIAEKDAFSNEQKMLNKKSKNAQKCVCPAAHDSKKKGETWVGGSSEQKTIADHVTAYALLLEFAKPLS